MISGMLFGSLQTIEKYEKIEENKIKKRENEEGRKREEERKIEKCESAIKKMLPKNMLQDLFHRPKRRVIVMKALLNEYNKKDCGRLLISPIKLSQHETKDKLLYVAIKKALKTTNLKTTKQVDQQRVLECFKILVPGKHEICKDKAEFELIYKFFILHLKVANYFQDPKLINNENIIRMNNAIYKLYKIKDNALPLSLYLNIFNKEGKLPKLLHPNIISLIMMHLLDEEVFHYQQKPGNYIDNHKADYLELAEQYPKVAISSLKRHHQDINRKNHQDIWDKLIDTLYKDDKQIKILLKNVWHIMILASNCLEILDKFYDKRTKVNNKSLAKELFGYYRGLLFIFLACEDLNVELAKAIFHFKPKSSLANVIGRDNQTPMTVICAQEYSPQQIAIAKIFLENGADVNGIRFSVLISSTRELSYKGYESNLELAIKNKNLELVKLLCEKGADVNMHFLAYACEHGNLEIVEYLFSKCKNTTGFDINKAPSPQSYISQKPLIHSLSNKDKNERDKIMKFLIKNGAETNSLIDYYLKERGDQSNVVKALLLINTISQHCNAMDLFFKAIDALNLDLVKAILEFKTSSSIINTENRRHKTAMHLICEQKHSERQIKIAELLLEKGGDVNGLQQTVVKKDNLKYKLHESNLELAIKNKNLELVKLLCKRGADVNMHFLAYSCMHGDFEIVKYLLSECKKDKNFDINKAPSYPSYICYTPLMYCLFNNKEERYNVMRLLIEKGADTNAKILGDVSVLRIAVERVDKVAVEILLNNESEVNSLATFQSSETRKNMTPLHIAIDKHQTTEGKEVIKTLIKYKADPKLKDSNDESCIDIVNRSKDPNIQI